MGEMGGSLRGRRVLIHVCGGIAAVKVPELITGLRREGADVRVAMTETGATLVSPRSLQALSGHPVALAGGPRELGRSASGHGMEHLELADWADCHLVAPATASTMARLAVGLADDLTAATLLATDRPILLAPAMETNMWLHAATRGNVQTLLGRGVKLIGPSAGRLALGKEGEGRMADPERIQEAVRQLLGEGGALSGVEILVTAGGTREPVDPVRFLGNRSSGRMGFSLAREAARRGARVHLVTAVEPLFDLGQAVVVSRVDTTAEMLAASLQALPRVALVLMAAAVADYRVAEPSHSKLNRRDQPHLQLQLAANTDILAELISHRQPGCLVVGFAAETEAVRERGWAKLRQKGCDMLVANPVAGAHSSMGGEFAEAWVLLREGDEVTLPWAPKEVIASGILDLAQARLKSGQGTAGRA